MKKAQLLSTVAATLLLAVGVASAQDVKKDETPARAPAAQQNAPAEKVAPAMKPGAQNEGAKKAPETTGQAQDSDKAHAIDKGAMDKGAMDKNGQGAAAAGSDVKAKTNENTAQGAADTKSSSSTTAEKDRATTGQGAAGSAKLSTEQRSKITTVIRQQKVTPIQLNVSVRVGTRVPDNVRFHRLPSEVVVIYPEWRGYDYILVGNDILVIDPHTHEIVAVLEA